jgi:hypothetical protein
MWWAIGIGGSFLCLLVAITLGVGTLRNGHGWMFFFEVPLVQSVAYVVAASKSSASV